MLVYRDHVAVRSGRELERELLRSAASAERVERARLEALLRAAELECALADRDHPAAPDAARVCSRLATLLLTGNVPEELAADLGALSSKDLTDALAVKRPEGYAYYALDPRSYAEAARNAIVSAAGAVVVGIRSIGTSLSAVFAAALAARGVPISRLTVRPEGDPWDRRTRWTAAQQAALRRQQARDFFVVDEGPGLSGSTFLSVAEALSELGVPAERIVLCPSHPPHLERLVARDAARRWSRYRTLVAHSSARSLAGDDLAGGRWRERVFASRHEWPASFTQLERVKILRGRELHKFEGFAPYDSGPFERASALARAGYAPDVRRATEPGFFTYSWCEGRPGRSSDRRAALARLAHYVAYRACELGAREGAGAELERMTRLNLAEGLQLDVPAGWSLCVERPVFVDGRMMPHEWLLTPEGTWLKVDGADHGDDHLLPGPADVAWDLAGAIVEWQLERDERTELLALYREQSGDDASRRVPCYELAYCSFRLGVLGMAERSSAPDEVSRSRRERLHYEEHVRRLLKEKRP